MIMTSFSVSIDTYFMMMEIAEDEDASNDDDINDDDSDDNDEINDDDDYDNDDDSDDDDYEDDDDLYLAF